MVSLFQRLRRAGANVMMPEYVGYGLGSGAPDEQGCYATADAAWQHLRSRPDVDADKVVAMGASLGGAVAIDLAARARPGPAGLMTILAFTSIPDMARVLAPGVPIGAFIRHRFDSVSKMPAVTCPVLLCHSTGDRLVPYAMADRLAANTRAPVTRLMIEGADHRSAELLQGGGEAIFGALDEFLGRLGGR